ncbi:hypothetical protein MKZ20_00835 [Psychrobacillus sp. FSL K6-2684]|nr:MULTISPECIES: hypothetical protein [Psychrobacillus]
MKSQMMNEQMDFAEESQPWRCLEVYIRFTFEQDDKILISN